MPRLITIVAILASAAMTPAFATTGVRGTFRVAETASDAPREKARVLPFASLFLLRFDADASATSSTENGAEPANSADPSVAHNGCSGRPGAEAQKDTPPAKRLAAGPEPIYLAF